MVVYRKSAAATIGGLALLPALCLAEPLAVVDLHAVPAREWRQVFRVRDDLGGGRLLIELDDPARGELDRLGAPAIALSADPEAALYRVVAADLSPVPVEGAGKVLWQRGGQALLEVTREPEVWALAGGGVSIYRVPPRPALAPLPRTFTMVDDPRIDQMVAVVGSAEIDGYVQTLQNFGTRYSNLSGGVTAQAWVAQQLQSFGGLQIEGQPIPNMMTSNVCATLPGVTTPSQVYLVGGHCDSISSPPSSAPGADDNGSGCAAMLTVAHALAGHAFQSTLVFCGFSGEEEGLLGSYAWAQRAHDAGTDLGGMLNMDMIGYLAPGGAEDINVVSNSASLPMRQLYAQVVGRYLPSATQVDGALPTGAASDHVSFWQQGYPAIMLFEDSQQYTPYFHTTSDVVGTSYNSPDRAAQTARSAAAMMAVLAVPTSATVPAPSGGAPGCSCDLAGRAAVFSLPLLALLGLTLLTPRRQAG